MSFLEDHSQPQPRPDEDGNGDDASDMSFLEDPSQPEPRPDEDGNGEAQAVQKTNQVSINICQSWLGNYNPFLMAL